MQFTMSMTVEMDGAAFEDDEGVELSRIIATAAECVRANLGYDTEGEGVPLRDINGNTVGRVEFKILQDG